MATATAIEIKRAQEAERHADTLAALKDQLDRIEALLTQLTSTPISEPIADNDGVSRRGRPRASE